MARVDKETHTIYSQNEHGPQKSGSIGDKMEVEVKEAMQTLSRGDTRMTPSEALDLQDRLRLVDEKFALLRKEITRINSLLGEEKDKSDALRVQLQFLKKENQDLKKKPTVKKTAKKKTTTKKK